jgi:hypothetical protein
VIGSKSVTIGKKTLPSAEQCCNLCATTANCTVFTFEAAEQKCYFKSADDSFSRFAPNATSGYIGTYPPTPAPPSTVSIVIEPRIINIIDEGFKCWNIDASPNRQFETRDLSDPYLTYLGKESLPGYLRFGGGGNDGLSYPLNMSEGICEGADRCLNRTHFDKLMNFASDTGANIVFGLNIDPGENHTWDSAQARSLIQYAISKGHTFYGFELGNEQNNAYTAKEEAVCFRVLADLLKELYPDKATRPKLIGPDVHGLKTDQDSLPTGEKLRFVGDFGEAAAKSGVLLHALTHHEYIEVPEYPTVPPTPSKLDVTAAIATHVNQSLSTRVPNVQIWAGEIGPHNGKSPGCDHSSMRWANFGDSFWYLDAMATKAAHGYSVFCRQVQGEGEGKGEGEVEVEVKAVRAGVLVGLNAAARKNVLTPALLYLLNYNLSSFLPFYPFSSLLLVVAYCLLLAACCSLLAARCSLLAARCLLLGAWCLLRPLGLCRH